MTILLDIQHEFSFKAERNYVHGTSMFDFVCQHIAQYRPTDITISFHQPIVTALCRILISHSALDSTTEPFCTGQFNNAGKQYFFSITPFEERNKQRIPYQEDDIIAHWRHTPEQASARQNTGFTWIENLVALTKKLHTTHHPLPSGKKWLFGKLSIAQIIESTKPLTVHIISQIPNRLTRCQIMTGNQTCGEIYFTASK